MSAYQTRTPPALLIAVALSSLTIFGIDVFVPLGVAIWVLYFAPIALSKFASRPSSPLITAAACSILLAIGYLVSPEGPSEAARYSPINRTFGFVTMWAAAFIGRQFILSRLAVQRENWIKAAQSALSIRMQGELTHLQLAENVLRTLAEYLQAQVGTLYLNGGDGVYRRSASYALDPAAASPEHVRPGEGLVGQVARDNRPSHLTDVPKAYLDVQSGTGRHHPRELIIAPAAADGKVEAVIELGFLNPIAPADLEVLSRVSESVATAVRSVNHRIRQAELLEETQRQAEELQAQQEELRVQNEELEQQSRALQDSQARLENQQVELEQINSQLEEQTHTLERQRDDLARTHGELQRANQYKSEFLANMSHELRTPLNSSLILAKLLAENRTRNLTEEQIKFADTIYSAGNDLLTLINDILDLSKIEAGKLEVRSEPVMLSRLVDEMADTFRPMAQEKWLHLTTTLEAGVPMTIHTDLTRLQQILRNLLSNALKFTERGGVSLRVSQSPDGSVQFAVKDTGVGIPVDQHEVIFEAFRQANGTTNRKHGGTGLGLSISRDLARLLGGQLSLDSAPARGSTFTLRLPVYLPAREAVSAGSGTLSPGARPSMSAPGSAPAPVLERPAIEDDRHELTGRGRTILIIEDDLKFARILQDLAHDLDFQAIVADNAETGLAAAARYRPNGILLDVGLPDRSGLSVLDALKHDPATRHIPVHMVSVSDFAQTALEMGAAGYAIKPVKREDLVDAFKRLEEKFTRRVRRVLVVEDDDRLRDSTCRLLAGPDVECVAVGTGSAALDKLGSTTFDCMVLDLSLPDRTGFDLLQEMSSKEDYGFPPVIVYTGRSLSKDEEQELRRFSQSIIIKGARSPERLLDEATLFLHQVESDLPPDRQRMLRDARHREAVFEGRRVLVVEDDVRNIFALSSVLEPKGAKIEIARNGREALDHLREKPGVDLVLMDVMMPEMDGLQAMRAIRSQPAYAKLPIIALTAKAMADDRENCLAAGANDYIAKPLDIDKLLSLARVWMPK